MRETVIGLLFFASLAIVLYFAFTLGGPGSLEDFFGGEEQVLRINFSEVTGMKEKDDVLIGGMRRGSVVGFEAQEDGSWNVLARLQMDDLRLFGNAYAKTISPSILGGTSINILPGDPATGSYPSDKVMQGEYRAPLTDQLSDVLIKAETGIDDLLVIFSDVRDVVADMKAGHGPIGTLLRDEETAGRIKSIMANVDGLTNELNVISRDVSKMTQDINNAQSPIGRLVHDEEMGRNISEMLDKLNRSSTDLEQTVIEVRQIAEKLNRGEGTAGALLNDVEMKASIDRVIRNIEDAAFEAGETLREADILLKGVNNGKGTIGRLFQDETLYNDVVRAVNTLQAGFEDIREQAPITTFASLAFQVFQ